MLIKEFAEKYIKAENEAWENGVFESLELLVSVNVAIHNESQGRESVGLQAHKNYILTSRNSDSDRHQEWKFLMGDGNVFALSYKGRVISDGKGNVPTGKQILNNATFLFRLDNGKIVEEWINGSTTVSDPVTL